jgi:UDP-N-acetyl-D-galactosamine dehydrogenase
MIKNGISINGSVVGVMGITFKENCPDIRNTKIADVVYELKNWGINVVIEDPWASKLDLEKNYNLKLGKIDKEKKVDSLIVAVGHNKFRSISPKYLKSICRGDSPVLADVKSIYNKKDLIEQGFSVFRL